VPPSAAKSADPFLASLQQRFGFRPNHLDALAPLPRLVEAESRVSEAFLFHDRALTRKQKELVLLAIATANENRYTAALHYEMLQRLGMPRDDLNWIIIDYRRAGLPEVDLALLDFALKLGRHPTWATWSDIETLRSHGLADGDVLEAVLAISWGGYLCTLASGLGLKPNFEPPAIPPSAVRRTLFQSPSPRDHEEPGGPYLRAADLPESFPSFVSVRKRWGFIPNLEA
jgi:uncharacterized peroxidase-related enzyme